MIKNQVFIGIFFLLLLNSWGNTCKIEFFLLKEEVKAVDSNTSLVNAFHIEKEGLESLPFITDDEILSFRIKKDTFDSKIIEYHIFEVLENVAKRINDLNISLSEGRQFALLVNGNIVYTGYFWNLRSSFVCKHITAIAFWNQILIERMLPDFGFENEETDNRKNPILFDCLKATNRFIEE